MANKPDDKYADLRSALASNDEDAIAAAMAKIVPDPGPTSIRQRNVTDDELDEARDELRAAKKSKNRDAAAHAMEKVAILRAAHREAHVEAGRRQGFVGGDAVRTGD